MCSIQKWYLDDKKWKIIIGYFLLWKWNINSSEPWSGIIKITYDHDMSTFANDAENIFISFCKVFTEIVVSIIL